VLQNRHRWPEEEKDWTVVRNKTSPCISLGLFLSACNKWTFSAKLQQITWNSSAISRLFSVVVSKGANSSKVVRHFGELMTDSYLGKLCLDLRESYLSVTSAM